MTFFSIYPIIEIVICLIHYHKRPSHKSNQHTPETRPHLLYPRLQLEHVRLEVGGDLVSLVVERQPAVHKRQKLQEMEREPGSTDQFGS